MPLSVKGIMSDMTKTDRKDRGISLLTPGKSASDGEKDGGPVLIVIGMAFLLGLLLGASSILAFANETAKAGVQNVTHGASAGRPTPAWRPPPPPKVVMRPLVDEARAREIADKWGIRLLSLGLTAENYMIDFRFRVLDGEKARPFFDSRIHPYLLVERSKIKLPVPMAEQVGAFRTTNRGKNIQANRNYFMVFGNPDRHVKVGDKVTLVVGGFKLEHIKMAGS